MKTFIALLLISSISFADSINFGIWTDHSVQGDFNEDNRLIALEINGYVASRFVNSYNYETYLVAKQLPVYKNFGILAGLSHGYDSRCFTKPCDDDQYKKEFNPFAAFYTTKSFGRFNITLIDAIVYRNISIGINF